MCNRYSASRKDEIRQLALDIAGAQLTQEWRLEYNLPIKAAVPVVLRTPSPLARVMQWGTMTRVGFLFNASADTITDEPMWQEAAAYRRCLLLADGFFEFENVGRSRVGHYFSLPNRAVFLIAGLWLPAVDNQPDRCVMVTSDPNGLVERYHDRMPSILTNENASTWLGARPIGREEINRLCQPYPVEEMISWRSPPEMNRAEFQDPSSIQPWHPEGQLSGPRRG
jgi:putative SOS response-associated peptidase YedK